MSAVVIIPTTGAKQVARAIESVVDQTYPTKAYVVVDGFKNRTATETIVRNLQIEKKQGLNLELCVIPENVGANGFYGHRIYAAFSHLVNEDYVLFLDQDCWFDSNHVQSCVDTINNGKFEWCYSLRKICDPDGNYLMEDNCESLGKWPVWVNKDSYLIDTNNYCIKRENLIRLASAWHGGWGQDRVFMHTIASNFNRFGCSGEHTVNYCLAGNPGSVTKEFFEQGNAVMNQKYNGRFPWKKKQV